MGGHDHGHHAPYTVPKADIYKLQDAPELVEVQKALERRGLKDPWIRNEIWRFNQQQFSTQNRRLVGFLFRGFRLGFAAFVATIGIEYAFFNDKHGDEHGHDDHKSH